MEMSIEQKNEVIAGFMGYETRYVNYPDPALNGIEAWINGASMKLQYHSSWDWLHRAWDKFRALNFIHHPNVCDFMAYLERISNYMAYRTIEETHEAIFKAIQWYNNQSTTTNEQA